MAIDRAVVGDEGYITSEAIFRDDILNESVIDVGGGYLPLSSANFIVDRLPYEFSIGRPVRGMSSHRYSKDTWTVADICKPMSTFGNRQFDYSFCSQTVEDVRDPIGLASELSRISWVGFISTVNWKYELSIINGTWAGYWHHRWLVNVHDGQLEFIFKPPFLYSENMGDWQCGEPLLHIWWSGDISAQEIFYDGLPNRKDFIDFLVERWT